MAWTGADKRRIDPTMVFERWQDAIKLGRITDAVIIGLQVSLRLSQIWDTDD
jgi:hypothetical protein